MALPALAAATKIWRRMFKTEEQLAARRTGIYESANGANVRRSQRREPWIDGGCARCNRSQAVGGSCQSRSRTATPRRHLVYRTGLVRQWTPENPSPKMCRRGLGPGSVARSADGRIRRDARARRRSVRSSPDSRFEAGRHRRIAARLPTSGPEITPRSIVEAMLFVGHPQNEPLTSQQMAGLMRGVRPTEIDELVQRSQRAIPPQRLPLYDRQPGRRLSTGTLRGVCRGARPAGRQVREASCRRLRSRCWH